MKHSYTNNKNTQILIALLKAKGIKKVIVSPGTTNIPFIGSIQNDPYFEIYSVVDERSAAYMACGLAEETGEPVILNCTGATAARNYMSGLTEAFYRKLPILSITMRENNKKVGHNHAQITDRTVKPNDVVKHSVELEVVNDNVDSWSCETKVNNALLELTRHGGGPVHINVIVDIDTINNNNKLPQVRNIKRITTADEFPKLPKGRIAVFIGSHKKMNQKQIDVLDSFCASNDAVVFCDHTSGYNGKYAVNTPLYCSQRLSKCNKLRPDLLIHIGEITGDYYIKKIIANNIWRVSEDGELKDTFQKLSSVFEMSEMEFFTNYTNDNRLNNQYLNDCNKTIDNLYSSIPEIPFSNIWIAKSLHTKIPENSVIHFGILNSLRAWNFFKLPKSVDSKSNVGGFGIDGCMSSLIGASLANRNKLYYCVLGDLAFFYDLNSIGNRNIGNNIRILLVNNGKGTEFRNFNHAAAQFGDTADRYIAAAGHFGNKSETLVKNFSENLGFEYLSAHSKDEFGSVAERFTDPAIQDKPILLEVFTDSEDESKALEMITSISKSPKGFAKGYFKR